MCNVQARSSTPIRPVPPVWPVPPVLPVIPDSPAFIDVRGLVEANVIKKAVKIPVKRLAKHVGNWQVHELTA